MNNSTISMIPYGKATDTTPIDLNQALKDIGSNRWAKEVARIREVYDANGGGEDGKAATAPLKLRLPGFLFSGTFKQRADDQLIQHSGLLCCDLDHLGAAVDNIKEQVCADPHVLAAFRSPTGTGLKVVLKVDPTKDHKKESFIAAEQFMMERFGLEIDGACDNVSRICYVSHDPEIFIADDAEVIPYPPPVTEFKPTPQQYTNGTGTGTSPGDEYNERGDWENVLLNKGWSKVGRNGWRRPDKTDGISATWDKVEKFPRTFFCFSSSTEFKTGKVYHPWHIYALLECGGDFKAAAKKLGERGFGKQHNKPAPMLPLDKMIKDVRGEPKADNPPETVDEFAKDIDSRRVTIALAPPEPITRLFLAGKPICTPGNITTLISRAKTGKTATIGAAVAAIIAAHHDRSGLDTFGFTSPHTKEAVVMIDTEQALYDAFTCHQRALSRAQQKDDMDWLCHYAFVGYAVEKLKKGLVYVLEKAKAKHGGVFMLILDGIADFASSVNDEAECNQLVGWIREISVTYDCPVICVIHSNEGVKTGDDGRGHLGKQLTRKAESNLLLKKTGEITVVTSEKQRKAPITESDGVAFQWSDMEGRHVSCKAVPKNQNMGRPPKYGFKDIECVFQKGGLVGRPFNQALRDALSVGLKDQTFRRLVKDAVDCGDLIKEPASNGETLFRIADHK